MLFEGRIETTSSKKYFVYMKVLVSVRREEQECGYSTNDDFKGE